MIQTGRVLAFVAWWAFCGVVVVRAAEQSPNVLAPEGYTATLTAPGVTVYEYEANVEDGAGTYVQVIDLSAGARLLLLHGSVEEPGAGEGVYGGNSPRFKRHFMATVWESVSAHTPNVMCLVNGQFFRDTINGKWVDPTELAFPLKIDGTLLSEGYERRRFVNQRLMLELWADRVEIRPFSRSALLRSTAPNVIVGLDDHAYVRATERLGRTFIGAGDKDGDGQQETLLIFSSAAATQSEARTTLRRFGAKTMMMLDGGGSAQLFCDGAGYITQMRPLPQLLATVPASMPQEVLLEEGLRRLWQRLCCRWQ